MSTSKKVKLTLKKKEYQEMETAYLDELQKNKELEEDINLKRRNAKEREQKIGDLTKSLDYSVKMRKEDRVLVNSDRSRLQLLIHNYLKVNDPEKELYVMYDQLNSPVLYGQPPKEQFNLLAIDRLLRIIVESVEQFGSDKTINTASRY